MILLLSFYNNHDDRPICLNKMVFSRYPYSWLNMEDGDCVLCHEPLSNGRETVCIHSKGSESINNAIEQQKDSITTVPGQFIHI